LAIVVLLRGPHLVQDATIRNTEHPLFGGYGWEIQRGRLFRRYLWGYAIVPFSHQTDDRQHGVFRKLSLGIIREVFGSKANDFHHQNGVPVGVAISRPTPENDQASKQPSLLSKAENLAPRKKTVVDRPHHFLAALAQLDRILVAVVDLPYQSRIQEAIVTAVEFVAVNVLASLSREDASVRLNRMRRFPCSQTDTRWQPGQRLLAPQLPRPDPTENSHGRPHDKDLVACRWQT